ncbi:transporter suffix domain-containing protein [bacterium]|nr:transporter suffix domain-containing protein [bacterium]
MDSEFQAGWRLKAGAALFGMSILMPIAGVPLVATLGLSTAMTASLSGALLVGAEVLGVCAVAVMGKSGFAFIKSRVFGFLKQHGPPQKVSRGRYRIGLVIFCVPLLFAWLSPYISRWVPGLLSHTLPLAIGGDILILVSLVLLGGDFWDKIRSLFIHNAEVRFE